MSLKCLSFWSDKISQILHNLMYITHWRHSLVTSMYNYIVCSGKVSWDWKLPFRRRRFIGSLEYLLGGNNIGKEWANWPIDFNSFIAKLTFASASICMSCCTVCLKICNFRGRVLITQNLKSVFFEIFLLEQPLRKASGVWRKNFQRH